MRKFSKILLIITIILSFIIVPQTTFAKGGNSLTNKHVESEDDISRWSFTMDSQSPNKVIDVVGFVIKLLRNLSIILTVAVITILGIKYMIGSVEQKVEYKKAYVSIIMGVVLITTITSIVDVIFSAAQN